MFNTVVEEVVAIPQCRKYCPAFKMYVSNSTKVLPSKCTQLSVKSKNTHYTDWPFQE